jgi:hypothetical protein
MGLKICGDIMFKKLLTIIPIAVFFGSVQVQAYNSVIAEVPMTKEATASMKQVATQQMSLNNRYGDQVVSNVFSDNILLNLAYMSGKVQNAGQINWDEVRKPSKHSFTLQPGEVFAFHDDVLPEYQGRVVKVSNAHFGAEDGFLAVNNLYGNGVCHFASLINWSARDAGLTVTAPTNHDFAMIPGIDPMYGTAIYSMFGTPEVNMQQNLYVENTFDTPVKIVIENTGTALIVSVFK